MSRTRQILVATGTFSVALGIGFVMQNGDALAARFGDASVQALPAPDALNSPVVSDAQPGTAAYLVRQHLDAGAAGAVAGLQLAAVVSTTPEIPPPDAALIQVIATEELEQPGLDISDLSVPAIDATQVSLVVAPETTPDVTEAPVLQVALETDPVPPMIEEPPVAAAPDCTVGMTATPKPAALVDIALAAPCAPEARVTIHHQGMMFSVITDASGQANVTVPALAESAVFIADLGDGAGAVAVATVPDLGTYDRAVLQWQGASGPEIHALEFGAGYGDEGHVWNGAARSAQVALAGQGGFLVRLGDGHGLNPLMAEVYTYPSGQSAQGGQVAFSVETPVTPDNCGTEIEAQTIQLSPGADAFSLDLTMSLPACEAVGEYLVLKNMLLDLTLAAK